jgi:hypothetical protein
MCIGVVWFRTRFSIVVLFKGYIQGEDISDHLSHY